MTYPLAVVKTRKERFYIMKKIIAIILLFALILAFSACSDTRKVEVIADTETIYIAKQGSTTTIIDRAADITYTYKMVRRRKTDDTLVPDGNVKTETIEINTLPNGGIAITDISSQMKYTIEPKANKLIRALDELGA